MAIHTGPEVEPYTAEQLAEWMHIDVDENKVNLDLVAIAVRRYLERRGDLTLIHTTFLQTLDHCFPRDVDYGHSLPIKLMARPLAVLEDDEPAVSSIKYRDGSGAEITLDPSRYRVSGNRMRPIITVAPNYYWPHTELAPDAVTIEFVAGYSDTAESVPPEFGIIARMLADLWWNHPDLRGVSAGDLERTIDAILGQMGTREVT